MQNIREDKGYSYGANAVVASQKFAGVLLSTSQVATEVTGAALKEFLYELDRLPKGDFTQEEFERARETWKSELVQSFETQSGVLATISSLYLNQKSVDAINAFARSLDSFTLEQFNEIAREFPTVDQISITLVGDKNTILEQIKDMDLPQPTFRDLEGKIIP
jgi:predicted Zn-dependent peptidase